MGTGPRTRRGSAGAIVAAAVALCVASPLAGAGKLVPNPANDPRLIDEPIEGYRYDKADHCTEHAQPGARALAEWLDLTIRGESWGIVRCEHLSPHDFSIHAEGRALDWHLDARKPKQRHSAMRLIDTLLAPDQYGNSHALARRMGIQGIIFDCRAWWSGMEELGDYSYCEGNGNVDPTAAHKDHIHLELNWPGARKQTSFWRSPVAG